MVKTASLILIISLAVFSVFGLFSFSSASHNHLNPSCPLTAIGGGDCASFSGLLHVFSHLSALKSLTVALSLVSIFLALVSAVAFSVLFFSAVPPPPLFSRLESIRLSARPGQNLLRWLKLRGNLNPPAASLR